MSEASNYLLSHEARARWMRFDTAQILKRFFFCERSLLVSQAAWIPLIAPLDVKIGMARIIWQSAETAHALRERVFELRFPSRILEEEGSDHALVTVVDAVKDSPNPAAFLLAMGQVFLPALRDSYREYLDASDPIADGPTHRFLSLALAEKQEQAAAFAKWAEDTIVDDPSLRAESLAWARMLAGEIGTLGGIGISEGRLIEREPQLSGRKPYAVPDLPARDPKFARCRFYWPDVVDPSFPYGEGMQLQLRSAISHLNEVWAIEAAGVILSAFAEALPWEWIHNAARWTYDESRHCQMGFERLMSWNLDPREIPLGTYIYDSASGQDPIYRLGMLYFFETKNIRHKPERAQLFHSYGDMLSQHDMDFDWADETIHAGYGKHWLKEILRLRGQDASASETVREKCGELVSDYVRTATQEEISDIKRIAAVLTEKARGNNLAG
jgi:uncharacterized ferritin-like protein (DUF455 family)